MSLSITPTLALVGEAETTPAIKPESLAATYKAWVSAAEALIAAHQSEAVSFDDLVVTIGRANLDSGVSLRDIASQLTETGVPMPVVDDEGNVKRMMPSKSTVDRWVALYVVMRDGDVTSHVVRSITEGMGNVGMPTCAAVRAAAEGAAVDGKDVLAAVRALFSKAKAEAKTPAEFDPAKEIKRLLTGIANLSADGVNLTTDDKANIASLVIRAQALIA
jgi:hypothetical protein